jgi:hypothetical protein
LGSKKDFPFPFPLGQNMPGNRAPRACSSIKDTIGTEEKKTRVMEWMDYLLLQVVI